MIDIYTPLYEDGRLFLAAALVSTGAEQTVPVRRPNHHIWDVDCSGSMWNDMAKVRGDLKRQARRLQPGDALTVMWFSSKGENGILIKGYKVTGAESYLELDDLFDGLEARNLTNFSDTLAQLDQIVADTAFLKARTCFVFFSDGLANSPSVSSEKERVREIMKSLNGRLDLVLTVAYSDYADKQFLSEMATLAGGSSVAAAYLKDFSDALANFIAQAETVAPRVKYTLPDKFDPIAVFTIDQESKSLVQYAPDDERAVYIIPPAGAPAVALLSVHRYEEALVLGVSGKIDLREALRQQQGSIHNGKFIAGQGEGEALLSGAYGAAVVLSQMGRLDDAIAALGYIGDKRLVQAAGSAFAPTEIAKAENLIREAATVPAMRWFSGFDFDAVPKADAFCVMDALEMLRADENARFYPRHEAFRYKKIGRGSTPKPGTPKFTADLDASCPFSEVVWNKNLLNMSIRAKIWGYAELPESVAVDAQGKLAATAVAGGAGDALSVQSVAGSGAPTTTLYRPDSLDRHHRCAVYRTYTLVYNGFKNAERLPVSVSQRTADYFNHAGGGVLLHSGYADGHPFGVLDLSTVPIINRNIADVPVRADGLALLAADEAATGARLKVVKFLRDELDPKKEIVQKKEWSIDEQRFLTALGFADLETFSPGSDPLPATDHHEATWFDISLKGWSSLPKVQEVREKLAKGGKLNAPAAVMAEELQRASGAIDSLPVPARLKWLDERRAELEAFQRDVRADAQRLKFAKTLGHKPFADRPTKEEEFTLQAESSTLPVPVEVKFRVTTKEIAI